MRKIILILYVLLAPKIVCGTELNLTESEKAWIQAHRTIKYAIDPRWQPIEFMENGQPSGLTVAYLKKVAQISGLDLNFVKSSSWDESVKLLGTGVIDLLPGIPDFELPNAVSGQLTLSAPYFVSSTIAVAGANNRVFSDFNDFSTDDIIAIRGGGAYESWMRRNFPALNLHRYDTTEDALVAVANGEATVAIGPEPILHPAIRQHFSRTLYIAGVMRSLPLALRVGTNASSPELQSIVQKALSRISAEQSDAIQERWIEDADYGKPSAAALAKYYGTRISAVIGIFFLLLMAMFYMWRARSALLEISKQRAAFLSVMAHEIRTPLNYILSSIELAHIQTDSTKMREYLNIAVNGGNTLITLLNDALNYSRINESGVHLERRPTLIVDMLTSIIPALRILADKKKLAFEVSISDEVNVAMLIDETRIKQVLTNILSNSIKFTEIGSITLRAHLDPDSSGRRISFEISDTGVGISQRDISNVFKPFFQANPERRDNIGSGLGLSICKEIIRAMNGSISVSSRIGEGTTIKVSIPFDKIDPPPAACNLQIQDSINIGASALVVEDVELNQFVLKSQLEHLGLRVTMVGNGKLAIQEIENSSFDIIFVDCNLPDISGYDVVRFARASTCQRTTSTPIIAISADSTHEHIKACYDCGMDGVLTKPISLSKLSETLSSWLCNIGYRDSRSLEQATFLRNTIDIPRPIHDDVIAESILREASEAMRLIAESDYSGAQHHIHRLKGIATTFGKTELTRLIAEQIENETDNDILAKKLNSICDNIDRRMPY